MPDINVTNAFEGVASPQKVRERISSILPGIPEKVLSSGVRFLLRNPQAIFAETPDTASAASKILWGLVMTDNKPLATELLALPYQLQSFGRTGKFDDAIELMETLKPEQRAQVMEAEGYAEAIQRFTKPQPAPSRHPL